MSLFVSCVVDVLALRIMQRASVGNTAARHYNIVVLIQMPIS